MIKLAKFPAETRMLLLITCIGAFLLLSFSVFRASQGNFQIASLDFLYFFGIVAGSWHIIVTGQTRKASIFLMFLSYSAFIPMLYLSGIKEVNWIYPIMAASFFMLRPAEALALNILALLICIPQFRSLWPTSVFIYCVLPMFLINIFCFMFAKINWIQKQKLAELAAKDPLTGIGNRRAFSENVDKILMSHKRKKNNASLISFDIDNFKSINDSYGHLVGDQLLVDITEVICGRIRSTDNLYRQGGEEFIIVAMDTNRDTAAKLAEELRQLVENAELHQDRTITISFGVAELSDGESHHDWIKRVDSALYEAKMSGRNAVCVSA